MCEQEDARRVDRRQVLARMLALGAALFGLPAAAQANVLAGWVGHGSDASRRVPWDERLEAAISFELVTPSRDRRPYVAVWIETPAGKPVRTVSLWVQRFRRSWVMQLRRYYRAERERRAEGGAGDLIHTSSGATRPGGRYTMIWNGRTDFDAPAEQGSYVVCIESVRQGGTYQLIRKEITFAATPFVAELGENVEIRGARVEYRERT